MILKFAKNVMKDHLKPWDFLYNTLIIHICIIILGVKWFHSVKNFWRRKNLFCFGFEAGFGANVANKTSWKREMLSFLLGKMFLTLFVLCYCKQTAVNKKVPWTYHKIVSSSLRQHTSHCMIGRPNLVTLSEIKNKY